MQIWLDGFKMFPPEYVECGRNIRVGADVG